MLAVLFSEEMSPFFQTISSFPTVVFSFFLVVSLLFWLVAIIGVIDIDSLDAGSDAGGMISGASSLLMKFGLNGVPITIIFSFVALIGWAVSYNAVYFLHTANYIGPIRWIFNIGIFVSSLYLSVVITAQLIKPLRSLFYKMSADVQKNVLGHVAVVRTSRVDEKFGEAEFYDGGAGLILKVRAVAGQQFKKNDRVVLLEYLESQNAYRVISEDEFNQ